MLLAAKKMWARLLQPIGLLSVLGTRTQAKHVYNIYINIYKACNLERSPALLTTALTDLPQIFKCELGRLTGMF